MLQELAPVRQVGERIVLREVPQLQGALLDALFQLRLVGAHCALGPVEFRSHVVERLRELVELLRSATGHACRQVARRQSARARRHPPDRPGNGPCGDRERQQREQDGLEGCAADAARRGLDRGAGFACLSDESSPGWRLEFVVDSGGQCLAVGGEGRATALNFCLESMYAPAQVDDLRHVFLHQAEPGSTGRTGEFLAMRFERPLEEEFALRRATGHGAVGQHVGRVAAGQVHCAVELVQGRACDDIFADDYARAASADDASVKRRIGFVKTRHRASSLVLQLDQAESRGLVCGATAQQRWQRLSRGGRTAAGGIVHRLREPGSRLGHRSAIRIRIGPQVREHGAIERHRAFAELAHAACKRFELLLREHELVHCVARATQRQRAGDREGADDDRESEHQPCADRQTDASIGGRSLRWRRRDGHLR